MVRVAGGECQGSPLFFRVRDLRLMYTRRTSRASQCCPCHCRLEAGKATFVSDKHIARFLTSIFWSGLEEEVIVKRVKQKLKFLTDLEDPF